MNGPKTTDITTIGLRTNDGSLSLDCEAWCSVFLVQGQQRRKLGADSFDLIVSRLRTALQTKNQMASCEIDGVPFAGVLSLFEEHTSLYLEVRANDCETKSRILVLEDRDGRPFHKLYLSASDEQDWLEKLKAN